jgi:hypothetical protein
MNPQTRTPEDHGDKDEGFRLADRVWSGQDARAPGQEIRKDWPR